MQQRRQINIFNEDGFSEASSEEENEEGEQERAQYIYT